MYGVSVLSTRRLYLCFFRGSDCLSKLGDLCDFGQHGKYIISPSFVHSQTSEPPTPEIDSNPSTEWKDEHASSETSFSSECERRMSSSESHLIRTLSERRSDGGDGGDGDNNNITDLNDFNHMSSFNPLVSDREHTKGEEMNDTSAGMLLQRCASERMPKDTDQSPFLFRQSSSERDELRHRGLSDSFDMDELSPSTSPPPNLVEYTTRRTEGMTECIDEKREILKESTQRRSRQFSWHALIGDKTQGIMGYVKNLSNQ